MYCKKCGKLVAEGSRFCTGCGTQVVYQKRVETYPVEEKQTREKSEQMHLEERPKEQESQEIFNELHGEGDKTEIIFPGTFDDRTEIIVPSQSISFAHVEKDDIIQKKSKKEKPAQKNNKVLKAILIVLLVFDLILAALAFVVMKYSDEITYVFFGENSCILQEIFEDYSVDV